MTPGLYFNGFNASEVDETPTDEEAMLISDGKAYKLGPPYLRQLRSEWGTLLVINYSSSLHI